MIALALYLIGALDAYLFCGAFGIRGFTYFTRVVLWPLFTLQIAIESVWDKYTKRP